MKWTTERSAMFPGLWSVRDEEGNLITGDTLKEKAYLIAATPEMLEALKEIAKMEGAYSRDPLTHAENVIENLTNIANKVIAKVEGE